MTLLTVFVSFIFIWRLNFEFYAFHSFFGICIPVWKYKFHVSVLVIDEFWLSENQGADLMNKYGINVPKGVAVSSIDEVKEAVKSAFPNENEVSSLNSCNGFYVSMF